MSLEIKYSIGRHSAADYKSTPFLLLLLPGRLVACAANLPHGSDHKQILSMFTNTAFWSLVGVLAVVLVV